MRLTHAQEAMAAAIEDQWLAAAVQTGPAGRKEAEAGVRAAYRLAGLPEPERIYWLGSPRAGALAASLLRAPTPGSPVAALDAGPVSPAAGAASDAAAGSGPAASVAGPEWVAGVHAELRRQGWAPGESGGAAVRRQVRTEPWAAARKAALAALGADGWAQLSAAAGRRSWGLVMDLIAGRLRLRLGEDITADLGDAAPAVRMPVLDAIYGQHDGTWLATFEAADRLCPDAGLMTRLTGLAEVARHSGWWWAFERVAVLTERPGLLERDNVGRLHRGEGAAMQFPDGYGLWAWRGMPIPPGLAAELPHLTLDRIRSEKNAEIRRVVLEHFGYERYLREAGARRLGTDETGTLWWLDLPGDEPLVMVEVVNSTPEPDGTSRVYWLRVPPETRTAREGVAWTFGLTAEEYHPLIQT
ncbi:hypothetical protein AMIS_45980 [Actinoplanes missouriensis 431]|uniref:DUF6745 domain-containing protein n=1 Tax=Actinoplanes missouriensis (strain ATCC 14538 / DSM 43046 / CBS 188.64 / JCM 3121 / NBRC 102363 / NCIMB 12654 / NRRL B-3342 / UNCC 431) TaxID=512565 RepID=I0H9Y1_ACTM4|nr:hypothetical protein [Actinoplanes missouriensis]BAL89818.1 hypothetical protein AMIS_45980 [Actinoplanes missouriensis 431]